MTGRLFCLMLLSGVVALAEPRHFSSGSAQTQLIELFTSEGCSSCPPAEAWLNDLKDNPGLWRDFVPVAFHVSYWDRLGWIDRFASRQFTDRQYQYSTAWGSSSVYTPCFAKNGGEWRDSPNRRPPQSGNPSGILRVTVTDNRVRIDFKPVAAGQAGYETHVALLGGGIKSPVKAGENHGRLLTHEFLVLTLATHSLSNGRTELMLPTSLIKGPTRHALAVWVTRPGKTEVLQATGGWID